MFERNIDPYEELTDDFCNFLEAHPWHCETQSNPLDYEYRANGWVHVPDDPDVEDGPYCPYCPFDALDVTTEREVNGTADKPHEPLADKGSGDMHERKSLI